MMQPDATKDTEPEDRGRSARVRVVAVAVIVLAAAAAGWFGYARLAQRTDAGQRLEQATRLIEQADTSVALIDEVVAAPIEIGLDVRAREAIGSIDGARTRLRQAVELLVRARSGLSDDDLAQASSLQDAAEARLTMLDSAPALLAASASAAIALPEAEAGWDDIVEANALTERAVKEYNRLTEKGVRASRSLNKRAAAKLASARARFLAAEEAFPQARFELYRSYADARIELNRLSQRSDAAWLDGDIVKANDLIETYNARDKRTVEQAKALPASLGAVIQEAYDAVTRRAADEYAAARAEATEADAAVRRF